MPQNFHNLIFLRTHSKCFRLMIHHVTIQGHQHGIRDEIIQP